MNLSQTQTSYKGELWNKNNLENNQNEIQLVDELNDQAEILRWQNQDFQMSLELSEQAFVLAENNNYRKGLGYALINIGSCLIYTDFSDDPFEYLYKSLKIFRELNDQKGEAHALVVIGAAHFFIGRYVSAYYKFEQGLNLSILANVRKVEMLAYYGLAMLSEKLEDPQSTIKYCEMAASIPCELNLKARVLEIMGTVLLKIGRTSQAKEKLVQALEESLTINDKYSQANIRIQLGRICLEENKMTDAKEQLNNGLDLAQEIGLFENAGRMLDEVAESYIKFQDYKSALEILNEFRNADEIKKKPNRLAIVLMKIAIIQIRLKNTSEAEDLLNKIWDIAENGRNKKLIYECQKAFAEVFELNENFDVALRHYKLYHQFKAEFDNDETAQKIKILADKSGIENERAIQQVTKEKNAEIAQAIYEVFENIDKLQAAKKVISDLQTENKILQESRLCFDCRKFHEVG